MEINPNQLMVLQNPGMASGQMGGVPMIITPMVVTQEQMELMKKNQAHSTKKSSRSKDDHHSSKSRDRSSEGRHHAHSSSHRSDSKRESRDYHRREHRDDRDRHDSRSRHSHRSPSASHHSSSSRRESREPRSRDYGSGEVSYEHRTRSSSGHSETRPHYSPREKYPTRESYRGTSYRGTTYRGSVYRGSTYRGTAYRGPAYRGVVRARGTFRGRRGYDNRYTSTRYPRDEPIPRPGTDEMRSPTRLREPAHVQTEYEPRGRGRGRGFIPARGRGAFALRRPTGVTRTLATSIVRKYTTTPRLTTRGRGRVLSTRGFRGRGVPAYTPRAFNYCTLCKFQFYGTRFTHTNTLQHQRNVRARKHQYSAPLERHRVKSDEEDDISPENLEDLVILDSVGESDEDDEKEKPQAETKESDQEEQQQHHHHRKRRRLEENSESSTTKETAQPAKPLHTIEITPPDPELDQYGACYIIPVSGFFCKLCCKFYHNEAAAKRVHIKSSAHLEKLKNARVVYEKKLAEEKEKERLATEVASSADQDQKCDEAGATPAAADSTQTAVSSSAASPSTDSPTPKMTALQKITTKAAKAAASAKMAAATSQAHNRGTVLKKTATTRVTKIPAVLAKRMSKKKASRAAANAQEGLAGNAEPSSASEAIVTQSSNDSEGPVAMEAMQVDSSEPPVEEEEMDDDSEVPMATSTNDEAHVTESPDNPGAEQPAEVKVKSEITDEKQPGSEASKV